MSNNLFDIKNREKYINLKTYVFDFGKYIESPIKEIVEIDPGYIIWCHENISWFKLKKRDFKNLDKKSRSRKRRINQVRQYLYSYDNYGPYVEYYLEVYGNDAPF
jgi:hypothetical protein